MDNKPVIPTIVNIDQIHDTLKGPTLLHFTEAQWKYLIEGLEKADKLDEKQLALEVVHLPRGNGEMLAAVAASGPCPLGCIPEYIYEKGIGEFGQPTIDRILVGCHCSGPPPPPPGGKCHPAFVRSSGTPGTVHVGGYKLACIDNTTRQQCTDYVVAWWPNPRGGGYIYCKHK